MKKTRLRKSHASLPLKTWYEKRESTCTRGWKGEKWAQINQFELGTNEERVGTWARGMKRIKTVLQRETSLNME